MRRPLALAPGLALALAKMLVLPGAAGAVPVAEVAPLTETLQRILTRVLVERTMVEACGRADRADMVAQLNGVESDASWQLVLLSDPASIDAAALKALEAEYGAIEDRVAAATREYLRPC